MKIIHISYGGPDRVITDQKGKQWHFEDHPHCGTTVTDKYGNIKDAQQGSRSQFWKCVNLWIEQGKRVTEKGGCIWEPEVKQEWVCIGGKNYAPKGSALAKRFSVE